MRMLSREETHRKLHELVYATRKVKVADICKALDMDASTVNRALQGEMTERSVRRFNRFFDSVSRSYVTLYKTPKENRPDHPWARKKKLGEEKTRRRMMTAIKALRRELVNYYDIRLKIIEAYDDKSDEELFEARIRHELLCKRRLLLVYSSLRRTKFELPDHWDYWQWKEKLQLNQLEKKRVKYVTA